jgi:sarcosine oxidase subunit delta
MKMIPCPLNGLRPAEEFVYGGEARGMPDPALVDDARWSEYVFHRSGAPGVKREWWCHAPSGFWFLLDRDTATDRVLGSWAVNDAPPANAAPPAPDAAP